MAGSYTVPLDSHQTWNVTLTAATAVLDYLPGFEQSGQWHSGVGTGGFYTSRTWRVMLDYGYGIDAIRSGGRGAHSVGLLFQNDLEPARPHLFYARPPAPWTRL